MKIGILRIGQVELPVINRIIENLDMAFPETTAKFIDETLPLSEKTLDKTREQYDADTIMRLVHEYGEKEENWNKILGVVDVDVFSDELNFVFGKAECPGKAALISMWRLKPQFYGAQENLELFVDRGTKEAVHELGHTFGLKHCSNPFCVMYFSNSIFETDRKQSLFCNVCYMKIERLTHEKKGVDGAEEF
jgi:archaemetzincin